MHIIEFKKWRCHLYRGAYSNGRVALQLRDAVTGDPIAICTVNLPEVDLEPSEVLIKDWSENEGMADALQRAGVIHPPRGKVETGPYKVVAYRARLVEAE